MAAVAEQEAFVWVDFLGFDFVDFGGFFEGFADFEVGCVYGLVDGLSGHVEFSCDVGFWYSAAFRSQIVVCLGVKYPRLSVILVQSCKPQMAYIVSAA